MQNQIATVGSKIFEQIKHLDHMGSTELAANKELKNQTNDNGK